MTTKLAFRNMKRSAKNYLVYILTISVAAAMMYSFNSLIFQNDLNDNFNTVDMLGMMLIFATVFVVLILAWLIHYMVRFMLEKRSSEFGIYLLLGMRKKSISRLYMRENILLGGFAFLIGIPIGILFQQTLMAVLFSIVQLEYHIHFHFHKWTVLMTVLCYGGCYLLALFRCRRRFKKMNIQALMNEKRCNEEIKEKHEEAKRILFPFSILFILAFWTVFTKITNTAQLGIFLTGLVITIYLFYIGISSWIICYVRQRRDGIYKGQNLFLLRQFASKVKTMQFTMGTLTALFTVALMGASIAFMFSDYENKLLDNKFPFDVQIYSPDASDDFAAEKRILTKNADVAESYIYRIYTDKNNQANVWMLTHLKAFGTMYLDHEGNPDMPKIKKLLNDDYTYCAYDTYMCLSDYNHLRNMLGYEPVLLEPNEYAVHIKSRLKAEISGIEKQLQIADASGGSLLSCLGIYSEPFSQDGHNGGDYILIVPDAVLTRMQPYYSELAVSLNGHAPSDLEQQLNALTSDEERDFTGTAISIQQQGNGCAGSDVILTFTKDILVREILIPEVKYMLASLIIPLLYIGLVFLCVAVTVLSVQQLSDSVKFKFRYDVLDKMGLERIQIRHLIQKQLTAYYLCLHCSPWQSAER